MSYQKTEGEEGYYQGYLDGQKGVSPRYTQDDVISEVSTKLQRTYIQGYVKGYDEGENKRRNNIKRKE